MRFLFFKYFVILFFVNTASAQQWSAIYKIDGEKCESIGDMELTLAEDLVVTGIYEDPGGCRFDSKGKQQVFAANADSYPGSHSTLFVARYDSSTKLKWAVNAYAENGIHPWSMHCDRDGNTLVTGNFRGEAVFNSTDKSSKTLKGIKLPGPNTFYNNPLNYFIAKYDPQGKLCWVKVGLSQSNSVGFQIETDNKNNVFVRAYCELNAIALDKNMLLPQSGPKPYVQYYSVIVIKYSPDGEEQWVTYGGNATIKKMTVDPTGNVVLEGSNYDNIVLFTSNGKQFVHKKVTDTEYCKIYLSPDGEVRDITSTPIEQFGPRSYKSVTDRQGRRFDLIQANPTESYGRSFKLVWNGKTYQTQWYDIFLGCYDKKGKPLWINQIGGANDDRPLDITLDTSGNVLVSGWYVKELEVRSQDQKNVTLSDEFMSYFLASYTPKGNLNWAMNTGKLFTGHAGDQCHLLVNYRNKLIMGSHSTRPFRLGKHQVSIRGPRGDGTGWKWSEGKEWYANPDAFIATMDIDIVPQVADTMPLLANEVQPPDSLISLVPPADPVQPDTSVTQPIPNHGADSVLSANHQNIVPPGNINGYAIEALLFPNPKGPEQQFVNVQLRLDTTYLMHCQITDLNGKLLQEKTLVVGPGVLIEQFSFQEYLPGIYLLILDFGIRKITKRVVVL